MRIGPAVLALVLLTSCSGEGGAPDPTLGSGAASSSNLVPDAVDQPMPPPSVSDERFDQEVDELAIFLAAVDAVLVDTSHAGGAFESPAAYIATGKVFCDLLDTGLELDQVLGSYVAALKEEAAGEPVEVDDLVLGGAILGAAVETICPQHSDLLNSGS